MHRTAGQTLRFHEYRLEAGVDLLYCGTQLVPLERRAAQVLRYLAEHHERVIPKEELLEHIWSDVFTTDGVLKKAISQIRRALGDDAGRSRFIVTFHRRGYRFIANVTLCAPPPVRIRRFRDLLAGLIRYAKRRTSRRAHVRPTA